MAQKCNIIVDSTCDLTRAYLEEHGVSVAHFTYTEAKSGPDVLEGVDDLFESRTAHDFYEAMRNGAEPMTSQPSPAEFEKVFRAAAESGVPTVCFTISSGISGCYGGALGALTRLEEEYCRELPIYVVDSLVTSTPLALIVMEAVRRRDEGCTAEELAEWGRNAYLSSRIIFMVDDLKALARGGRIPAGVAVVGSLLDVKPILTFDLEGKLTKVDTVRGRKKGMKKFQEFFREDHDASGCADMVVFGNADCPADVKTLEGLFAAEWPEVAQAETSIGPTIGCHVGPGMLSCAFWGTPRSR